MIKILPAALIIILLFIIPQAASTTTPTPTQTLWLQDGFEGKTQRWSGNGNGITTNVTLNATSSGGTWRTDGTLAGDNVLKITTTTPNSYAVARKDLSIPPTRIGKVETSILARDYTNLDTIRIGVMMHDSYASGLRHVAYLNINYTDETIKILSNSTDTSIDNWIKIADAPWLNNSHTTYWFDLSMSFDFNIKKWINLQINGLNYNLTSIQTFSDADTVKRYMTLYLWIFSGPNGNATAYFDEYKYHYITP